MGRKLYPPYIDGKIPAFCGTALKVPFRQNRAVSKSQYSAMACKFKTVSTNEYVWTIYSSDYHEENGNEYVIFNLNEIAPNGKTYASQISIGFYYKIQIAYVDADDVVGYFSDVGVVKYTAEPDLRIEGLFTNRKNTENGGINYIGVYSQRKQDVNDENEIRDPSEKIYQYSFVMLDEDGSTFFDTGLQLHNSSTDVLPFESRDSFICNKELEIGHTYRLIYNVITINGLEVSSPIYYIKRDDTVRANINATLHAETDFEDGYISVRLQPTDDKVTSGSFIISRADSSDNYSVWEEMFRFTLRKENPNKELFKDFTVEQGIVYQYALTQYNSEGLYSNKLYSEKVLADFEDMFLFDGKRQLKVRFNSNVSSFKNDFLESKVDTIGGQYPFIFRNGTVKYKEFPISGLLSYLADDQEFFIDKSKLGQVEFYGTDLTSDNVRAERKFKLEALEWLSNGEPKLFRSPTEGNYFVRLNNVSLSPNAQTGRMIHTFSATAFEIGEASLENLRAHDMFPESVYFESSVMHFKTIDLGDDRWKHQLLGDNVQPTYTNLDAVVGNLNASNKLPIPNVYLGKFENVPPDCIIGLEYANGNNQANGSNIALINIGRTEVYEINTLDNPVIGVYLVYAGSDSQHQFQGHFTFGYHATAFVTSFDKITSITREDYLTQWIGKHNDIVNEDAYNMRHADDEGIIDNFESANVLNSSENTYYGLNNIKEKMGRIYWIRFFTREIVPFYMSYDDNLSRWRWYRDSAMLEPFLAREVIDINVYKNVATGRLYDGRDVHVRLANIGQTWNVDSQQWEDLPDGGYSSGYVYFENSDYSMFDDDTFYWDEETKEPWTSSPQDTYDVDRQYKFSINHVDNNIDIRTIKRYELTNLNDVTHISMGRMLVCECYYCLTETYYTIENNLQDYQNVVPVGTIPVAAKDTYYRYLSQYQAWLENYDSTPSIDQNITNERFVYLLRKAKYDYYRILQAILNNIEEEETIEDESSRDPVTGG